MALLINFKDGKFLLHTANSFLPEIDKTQVNQIIASTEQLDKILSQLKDIPLTNSRKYTEVWTDENSINRIIDLFT